MMLAGYAVYDSLSAGRYIAQALGCRQEDRAGFTLTRRKRTVTVTNTLGVGRMHDGFIPETF
jgi:hypothetical protein